MNRDHFVAEYCLDSEIPRELFNAHMVAMPCRCGETDCAGWAAVPNDPDHIVSHVTRHALARDVGGDHIDAAIGNRLFKARAHRQLALSIVAESAQVDEIDIARCERGEWEPGAGWLRRVCAALDVDAHVMLNGDEWGMRR